MRIDQYFENYYAPAKLAGKSQNTYRLYRICFRHLARTLGRHPLLSDLTDTVIREFSIDNYGLNLYKVQAGDLEGTYQVQQYPFKEKIDAEVHASEHALRYLFAVKAHTELESQYKAEK